MCLVVFRIPAGWERVSDWRAGLGKSEGVFLVAWLGDALENQLSSPGYAAGGVVWRRDVLRGEKNRACV